MEIQKGTFGLSYQKQMNNQPNYTLYFQKKNFLLRPCTFYYSIVLPFFLLSPCSMNNPSSCNFVLLVRSTKHHVCTFSSAYGKIKYRYIQFSPKYAIN